MTRSLLIAAASAMLIAGGAPAAFAAPCKDAHGKFIKCPPAKAAAKVQRCRLGGKFAKCGTPGAKPA
ncbi:hypothetical protein [Sphingomonas sp.]|uniref:hypothetical protein n=1 Tax=Sphingomonas sp. TaxID=28214 RepID=UPI002CC28DB4|nr:hypothetical protein [Sphingomonas sp.]HWK35902.1 hypothetical protein [Sphingomonas sp.]